MDETENMQEEVKEYINKYPLEIVELFHALRKIIYDICEPEETLWAKLPSYYVGDTFVRLIPFKDHINVEAQEIMHHQEELAGYKITPKGMLQLYVKQDVPYEVLKKVFKETLER